MDVFSSWTRTSKAIKVLVKIFLLKIKNLFAKKGISKNITTPGAMVVTQTKERFLPIPEVCSLNQVSGKIYIEHILCCKC